MYRNRIIVCAPLTVTIMALSMIPSWQFLGWQWVCLILTVPVVTWGAWPFHSAALRNARHASTTMDTLVSLGVIASSLWSVWALIWGGAGELGLTMHMSWSSLFDAEHSAHHAPLYFEGAATIVLFLLIGRSIEHRSKGSARDALTALLSMAGTTAHLVDSSGEATTEHDVPTDSLVKGDIVRVRPGEKVPVDGVIVEGVSALEQAAITGESLPQDVQIGDSVSAGTTNTWGTLLVETEAVGTQTRVARIGQMVADAQASKANIQRLADTISAVFVPAVLLLSVVTGLGWILLGFSAYQAMTAAVAVLVVACPCALGLATPTALLVGSTQAAREGIIIRSAQALESSRQITTVLFDKTGTLTDGRMSVTDTLLDTSVSGEAAQWASAASVEASSEHPVARAIVEQARAQNRQPQPIRSFTAFAGHGVGACVGEELILVGKPAWLAELGVGRSDEFVSFQRRNQELGATVVEMVRIRGGAAWAVPTVVADQHVSEEERPSDAIPSAEFSIKGMTCASCVGRVERKLRKMGGVTASVNLATETALVHRERDWHPEDIIATIEAAGYEAAFTGWKEVSDPFADRGVDAQIYLDPHSILDAQAQVCAAFAVKDTVKEGAAQALSSLRDFGMKSVMLTGDNADAAHSVAAQVGIDDVRAELTPADKHAYIKALQDQGERVAMVGDGVNDAAALAQADLGIAMGSGTDIAQDVADIVLTTSRLEAVPESVRVSRVTVRIIKQNLAWAFGYNVVLLPLAVVGLLNPMLAAAAMSLSSVCVVGNSLRLRHLI